jgi:hypothetical protein
LEGESEIESSQNKCRIPLEVVGQFARKFQGGMLIALDEHGFSHVFMLTQSREHATRFKLTRYPA